METTTGLLTKKFSKRKASQEDPSSNNSQENEKYPRTQYDGDGQQNLQDKFDELKEEYDRLYYDHDKLRSENEGLKNALEKISDDLNSLKHEKVDKPALEQKIEELSIRVNKKIKYNEEIITALSATVEQYKKQVEIGNKKIAELEVEKRQLAAKSAETEQQLRKQLQELRECFNAIAGPILDQGTDQVSESVTVGKGNSR